MSSKTTRPTLTTTSSSSSNKVLRERQILQQQQKQSNQIASADNSNFIKRNQNVKEVEEMTRSRSCNKRKLANTNNTAQNNKSSIPSTSDTNVNKKRRQTEESRSIVDTSSSSSTSETYRIGDWVYCEIDRDQPYQIRRIEEFTRLRRGDHDDDDVYEARVRCAFRRSDIAPSLLANLEKRFSQHFTSIQSTLSFSSVIKSDEAAAAAATSITTETLDPSSKLGEDVDSDEETLRYNRRTAQFIQSLRPLQIYQLKHRELFYSRYYESNVPVSCFRGKLTLDLFMPEVNSFGDYLNHDEDNETSTSKDDNRFFYQICYDPNKNMISDDKMLIRVGAKFQAEIPDLKRRHGSINQQQQHHNRQLLPTTTEKETLTWSGPTCHAQMGDICLNKYLKKVVETKLKLNETYQDCELTETRDIIKYNAMRLLHNYQYDRNRALSTFDCNLFKMSSDEKRLTASSINENIGSKLWTKSEMKYFETGIEQFGKDFTQIRKNLLPNKPLTSIIEYYYNVYKITDEYIGRRDEKRVAKQQRLVEVKGPKLRSSTMTSQQQPTVELRGEDSQQDEDETTTCLSCQKARPTFSQQDSWWLHTTPATTTPTISSFPSSQSTYSQPVIKLTSNSHQRRGIMNNAILDHHHHHHSPTTNSSQFKLIDKPPMLTPNYQNDLKLDDPENTRSSRDQIGDGTSAQLCHACWIYWKKYGSFKYNYTETKNNGMNGERMCPEKRRNKANAAAVYTCQIDECGREFSKKSEFCHHATFVHCLLVKSVVTQPPAYKQLTNFYLKTSSATKTLRRRNESSSDVLLRRLARNPCHLSLDYKSLTLRGDKKPTTTITTTATTMTAKRPYVRRRGVEVVPSSTNTPTKLEMTTTTPSTAEPEVKVVRKRGRPKKNQIVEENNSKPLMPQQIQQQAQTSMAYTCQVDKCGQEFRKKKELSQHTVFTHGLVVKSINATEPRTYHDIRHFALHTTPATRAARSLLSLSSRSLIKQLARNPCKDRPLVSLLHQAKSIASKNASKMKARLDQMKSRRKRGGGVAAIGRALRSRHTLVNSNYNGNGNSSTTSTPSSKSSTSSSPNNTMTHTSSSSSLTNIVNRLETPPSKKHKVGGVGNVTTTTSKENASSSSANKNNLSVNLSPSSISSSGSGCSSSSSRSHRSSSHVTTKPPHRITSSTNQKLNYSNSSSHQHHHTQVNNTSTNGMKSNGNNIDLIELNSSPSSRKQQHRGVSSTINTKTTYNDFCSSSDIEFECCMDNEREEDNDDETSMILRLAEDDDDDDENEKTFQEDNEWSQQQEDASMYLKSLNEMNARINGTNSIEASSPLRKHGWYFKSNKDIKNTRERMIETRELKRMAVRPTNHSHSGLYDAIRFKTTLAAVDAKHQLKQALVKCLQIQSQLLSSGLSSNS